MARDQRASEFGGVPGLIQPSPHEPTESETLMQIYATEPAPPWRPDHEPNPDVVPVTKKVR